MKLKIEIEVADVQTILSGLGKLPLEGALETWFKVKTQAEQQLATPPVAAQAEPAAAAEPESSDQPA